MVGTTSGVEDVDVESVGINDVGVECVGRAVDGVKCVGIIDVRVVSVGRLVVMADDVILTSQWSLQKSSLQHM